MYSSPIYEGSNIFPHLTDREAEFKRNWPVQDHILSDGIWLSIEIYWIPELGLLIPIVIPPKRLICVSGENGDSLLFRVFSLHYMPQANISTPLFLHSKVGHSIWQTSAELRKPKRVKVHVTCSYWDFLGLAGSFSWYIWYSFSKSCHLHWQCWVKAWIQIIL